MGGVTLTIIMNRDPSYTLWENLDHIRNATPDAVSRFANAYHLAMITHVPAKRKSDESYFYHDCRVAGRAMMGYGEDFDIGTAALVHEFIEDDNYTREMIENYFGESIADIVVALSKLPKDQFPDRLSRLLDHIERMRQAIPHDWRIAVIKISDRLDNTTDTAGLSGEDKERLFAETDEYFLPLFRWAVPHIPSIEYQKIARLSIQEIVFACDNYWRSRALQL